MNWGLFCFLVCLFVLNVLLHIGSDGGEWMVVIVFWCCLNSSWLTHTFKSNSQGWEESEKQGYFLDSPVILLFVHPLVRFFCCSVTYSFSNTRFWACSLNCKSLSQWRGLSRSPAFVILILSFRVFGTSSADLVSESYIQSTNPNENIKPGQRQTLWVCTCSHFPLRPWITDDLSNAVFHLLPFQPSACFTQTKFSVRCSWRSTGSVVYRLVKPRPCKSQNYRTGKSIVKCGNCCLSRFLWNTSAKHINSRLFFISGWCLASAWSLGLSWLLFVALGCFHD